MSLFNNFSYIYLLVVHGKVYIAESSGEGIKNDISNEYPYLKNNNFYATTFCKVNRTFYIKNTVKEVFEADYITRNTSIIQQIHDDIIYHDELKDYNPRTVFENYIHVVLSTNANKNKDNKYEDGVYIIHLVPSIFNNKTGEYKPILIDSNRNYIYDSVKVNNKEDIYKYNSNNKEKNNTIKHKRNILF